MSQKKPKKTKHKSICLCLAIKEPPILKAIADGAKTTDEVADKTQAGLGPCGGSCRPDIQKLINTYKKQQDKPKK